MKRISATLALISLGSFAETLLEAQDRQYDRNTFVWKPELSSSGPVIVSVNLKSQTAAVYRGGVEIGSCLVSTGMPGHETPTGIFHILEKDADHHSKTYNNAAMPFSERLTWGGVALHAGALPGYPSSHGCIHLPYEFSKLLFGVTEMGGTVIITEDAPTAGVSTDHRIGFEGHEQSDFHWQPHDSPSGPVSILFSSTDRAVVVIRNGVLIGKGEAHLNAFAKKPQGTYAYVFDGWERDGKSKEVHPHWHQAGGPADSHMVKAFMHIKTDPRLQHVLESVIVPGTTLVVTDEPLSEATRSQPGFHIMSGTLAKE